MKVFYKKLNKNIVQEHAEHHEQKVPEKLNPAPENRSWEYDVAVQEVAHGKRYGESDKECRDVRADGASRGKHHLLLQDKVVGDEI